MVIIKTTFIIKLTAEQTQIQANIQLIF